MAAAEQAQREAEQAQREAEEEREREARELAQHEHEQISGNLTRRGGKSFRAKGKKASTSSSTEPKKEGKRLIGLMSTRGMGSRKTLINPNVGLHVDEQEGLLPGLHSEKTADEGRSKPKGKGMLAGLISTRGGPPAAARGRDMEPLEA